MLIVRFAFRTRPGKAEDAAAVLAPVVAASRALPGVISIDIARDITDPEAFIATEVYEDRAALDRQMELPETIAALTALHGGLIAESESLIHHIDRSEGFS
jgi:quinol monooxygenase YgiN